MLNPLLLGADGRGHATFLSMQTSPLVHNILWAPGNAGINATHRRPLNINDFDGVLRLAHDEKRDFICVGPEGPLCAGIVDHVQSFGSTQMRIFGPTAAAARLEGSKSYTKAIAREASVRTAPYEVVTTVGKTQRVLAERLYPAVLKFDGLAQGKGVKVVDNVDEALEFASGVFVEKKFGKVEPLELLVEEFIPGRELSAFFVCNGAEAIFIGGAGDYKRALTGNGGENTGGMGAYSPAPWVTDAQWAEIQGMANRIVEVMRERGTPYTGVLYLGLMITPQGEIYLLEINCRLGDPEAQVLLPRLEDGLFVDLMRWSVGIAPKPEVKFKSLCAVYTVVAAVGYPGDYLKRQVIGGLKEAALYTQIIHAGTEVGEAGEVYNTGGRVLGALALSVTFIAARSNSLAAARCIVARSWGSGSEFYCRQDIAAGI